MDEREKAARLDLLQFQVGELDKARLRAGEDEELETTRRVLSSADKLQRLCGEAYAALYDSDEAALARLGRSGSGSPSLPTSIPRFSRISRRATRSNRSSRISRRRCARTARRSTRRRRDCRKSKIGSRCSRGSSGSTVRRSQTSSRSRDALSRQLDALENADERRAGLEAETRVGAAMHFCCARGRCRASARDGREAVRRPHSGAARRAGDGAHAVRRAFRGGAARVCVDRNRRGCGRVLSLGERRGGPAAARAHCQRRRALARDARDPDAGGRRTLPARR